MRLGIRRKLIGTLMLVGLLPLALSLVVILVGGATMRLHSIHNSYEHKAADVSNQLASIVANELEKLQLIAGLPEVRDYAMEQTRVHAARRGAAFPATTQAAREPDAFSHDLDVRWHELDVSKEPLHTIMSNPLAGRLVSLVRVDSHPRECMATDAFGELIAADAPTDDYFQADEDWWTQAQASGLGRACVSGIVVNPASKKPVVSITMPIFDESGLHLVGIIRDKIDVDWFRTPLEEAAHELGASTHLYDAELKRAMLVGGQSTDEARLADQSRLMHGANYEGTLWGAISGELVVGSSPVRVDWLLNRGEESDAARDQAASAASILRSTVLPHWIVIISKPAQEAMTPVYRLAITVAAIGIAVILVLFILGVAISSREIILPIIRLREAAAAVGRGELNVRLNSDQEKDATFRNDELGQLARDFDDMTRELQKNVGQLARSNEAKRRFMELAGHELRTPVAYIIGACQLAQRQALAEEAAANSGNGGAVPATTTRTPASTQVSKIGAKAQRLSRIIDNLLKLVQTDSFTTRLARQPIDMRALVLQVCNDARPFIAERKQQLIVDVAQNLPTIEGDRDKLEDALTNLLSNAIRFSPDGASLRVAAHMVVGDQLEILVEDAGPGISPDAASTLFEPFTTGDIMHHQSGTIEYGTKGIGLGLAIVRRFVEIHGGKVSVHPRVGAQGTQFQILFDLSNREVRSHLPLTSPIAPDQPPPGL